MFTLEDKSFVITTWALSFSNGKKMTRIESCCPGFVSQLQKLSGNRSSRWGWPTCDLCSRDRRQSVILSADFRWAGGKRCSSNSATFFNLLLILPFLLLLVPNFNTFWKFEKEIKRFVISKCIHDCITLNHLISLPACIYSFGKYWGFD